MTATAGNSFIQDLMMATNSECVWSSGVLTVVPYGDTSITANGYTYTAPSAPLYSLDDDDFEYLREPTVALGRSSTARLSLTRCVTSSCTANRSLALRS